MAKNSKVLQIRYGNPQPDVELPDASIPPIDEAHFVSRPADSGNTYAEEQCDAIARQQQASYAERGEQLARDATIRAKSTEAHAGHAKERLLQAGSKSKASDDRATEAHVALDRFRQRPTNAKWLYYTRFIAIIGGDVAGVAGAALLLGETHLNAFLQAFASAVAAVTLASVGREVRYLLQDRERQRDAETLDETAKPFAHLFRGPHIGESLVKIVVLLALVGTLLISVGIFTLRDATQGLLAGFVFACLSLAVGLASFANAFDVADRVAELLDNYDKTAEKADDNADKLAALPIIADHAGALAERDSIITAHQHAGNAAAAQVEAHKFGILTQNPGVVGHGRGTDPAPPPPTPASVKEIHLEPPSPNGASPSPTTMQPS